MPIEEGKLNVSLSPVRRVAGAVPVREIQRNALEGWPAENSAGVKLMPTLPLVCAQAPGIGNSTSATANDNRMESNRFLVIIVLVAQCASYRFVRVLRLTSVPVQLLKS